MNEKSEMDKRYTTFAWGLLFLLFGVLLAVPGDQSGIFFLGVGVILLGLNLLRRVQRLPIRLFSTLVGSLALAGGLYAVVRPIWGLPHVEIGFIPLMLIVVGLYILIPAPRSTSDIQ